MEPSSEATLLSWPARADLPNSEEKFLIRDLLAPNVLARAARRLTCLLLSQAWLPAPSYLSLSRCYKIDDRNQWLSYIFHFFFGHSEYLVALAGGSMSVTF